MAGSPATRRADRLYVFLLINRRPRFLVNVVRMDANYLSFPEAAAALATSSTPVSDQGAST